MMKRYFRLAEHISRDDDELCELLPSARCVKRLKSLLDDLGRVRNMNKSFQGDTVFILDACVWFDGLAVVDKSLEPFLGKNLISAFYFTTFMYVL